MIQYGTDKNQAVEMSRYLGMPRYTINFDFRENEEIGWEWRSVTLPPGAYDYGTIVSAIVTDEYPSDKMQAVINNYLLTPDDAEIRAEFDAMQQWRAYAKQTAKEVIEQITVNSKQ